MAKLTGTVITSPIVPGLSDDTYATHHDIYGKGGYRAVQTIEERDAISYERRSLGMEVRVLTGEGAGVYYLKSFNGDDFEGVTSQDWELVVTPGSGDSEDDKQKEVYSGYLHTDGKFYRNSPEGLAPEEILGIQGALYLDLETGITYRYDGDSFEKINALSWINVD